MRARLAILACALSATAARAELPPVEQPPPAELESSGPADAPADLRRSQLQAAQANAAVALREAVLSLEVGRGFRVRDWVDRTHSGDALAHALSAARPLGGPRWVDEQTCQVQVVVDGGPIADTVAAMADHYPGGSPVGPDLLEARLAGWRRTAFSAAGSSVAGGVALQQARPRQAGVWAEVSDDDRRRTVAAAQADAVHLASDDLHRVADPLPLGVHVRGADALARPAVAGRVRAFLDAQPVTHIEFLDDRSVSLSMAIDAPGLAREVERAVSADQPRTAAAAATAGDWGRFRQAVVRSLRVAVVGTARAPDGPTHLPLVVLPIAPPDWVDHALQAEGAAPATAAPGRLRVKGVADAAAVARLRERLLALRVNGTTTLADAAAADPQLAAAVSRVLSDAHEYRVDYLADGSVHVRVSLDLREAWDRLRNP